MKKKTYLSTEKKVLRLLYQTKAPLTAYEVAKELNISFPTAQKYLNQLVKDKIVEEVNNNGAKKRDKSKNT